MTSKSVAESTSLDSILENIGRKLLDLRVQKGYKSHAEFARAHNLPRIQYWRMEKGKSNVTLKSLHRVLEVHNITLEDLFIQIAREKEKPD